MAAVVDPALTIRPMQNADLAGVLAVERGGYPYPWSQRIFEDCLRVNGKARIVRDETLLAEATVKGKTPRIGILVEVDEAYLHCAKAIRRSRLWDAESHHERRELPSLGKMILEQTAPANAPPAADFVAEVDELIEENYRNELY